MLYQNGKHNFNHYFTKNFLKDFGKFGSLFERPMNCYHSIPKDLGAFKIPKVGHYIWLNYSNKFKMPANITLETFISNLKHSTELATNTPWKYILWTNNEAFINSNHPLVQELYQYCEFRNINDIDYHLSSLNLIQKLLDVSKNMAAAVDILKYDIVNQHGGIVMDLNYKLVVDMDVYLKNNDFICQLTSFTIFYLENYMIGAKQNHPILNNFLYAIEEYFLAHPNYLSENAVTNSIIIYEWLHAFYIMHRNQDENCDLMLPASNNNQTNDLVINTLEENYNKSYLCGYKIKDMCLQTNGTIIDDISLSQIRKAAQFLMHPNKLPIYMDIYILWTRYENCPEEFLCTYDQQIGFDSADGLRGSYSQSWE